MTITVTQLGNFLKALVDSEVLLLDLNVEGEISGFRRNDEVAFFILKDSGAQIDCFCYNPPEISLTDGEKVVVSGKPNYYIKGGKLSFAVKKITPKDEKGEKFKQLMLLKERLEKEGLFDPLKKKPIVTNSGKIGVVTSAEGAVIHDILTVAARRNPTVDITLYHCKVQGFAGEDTIVRGIKYLENTDVDNIIIGRGGGSSEDLSVFNSEKVVYAVAGCKKPTISAVGHETDVTLCDFAADRRAATPSQAAELCTADIRGALAEASAGLRIALLHAGSRVAREAESLFDAERLMLTMAENRCSRAEAKLSAMLAALCGGVDRRLAAADSALGLAAVNLDENNPAKILSKGYSVTLKDGRAVSSVKTLASGDKISIVFGDGTANAAIVDTEVKNEFRSKT